MKDFEITGYPHLNPTMMICIAGVLLIVVVMIFLRKILEGYMVIFMLCALVVIVIETVAQFATGDNPIFLHDYKGVFQVAQVKPLNTVGSGGSDNNLIVLENDKGQQQAFSMKKQYGHKGGIKKGDKAVLRVRMNKDKKPVWTEDISRQDGEVISIKKLISK